MSLTAVRDGCLSRGKSAVNRNICRQQQNLIPPPLAMLQPVCRIWLCRTQSLRSLCLWEGWEFLEPQMASAIVNEVASGREPGPQSPYETRLTGECLGQGKDINYGLPLVFLDP